VNNVTPKQCYVIGDPVAHSLSPVIHNAGYRVLGIEREFEYSARRVTAARLKDFIHDARQSGVRGMSVTMPHKESVGRMLDEIDEVAEAIGAINTIVGTGGLLRGSNTDWIGAVGPLLALGPLRHTRVAIIGAGGAAKAFVFGLVREGADVTVYNRTAEKARIISERFGCRAGDMADLEAIAAARIICNTTPAGMDEGDELPVPEACIGAHHTVFDAVYAPYQTKLLQIAQSRGAKIIHGTEMLLHQGMAQFTLFTGHVAPEEAMRLALLTANRQI
jgi:shikimate dehydrogenase